MRRRWVIFAVATVLTTTPALRSQPSNLIHRTSPRPASAPSAAAPSGSFDTSRVVLSLGAVLGLILLLRWGGKRIGGGKLGTRSGAIQVLGRSYLSSRQQIIIVQIGRRLLVVGESGQQLTTLCEITDPDEAAVLVGQLRGDTTESAAASIANVFRETARRFRPAPASPTPPADDSQLANARQELNGLAEKVRVVARHLSGT